MRKLIPLFVVCLYLFSCNPDANNSLHKTNDLISGKIYTIHSTILNEERTIWIGLPNQHHSPHYSSKDQFPVAYVLDGDSHFQTLDGMIQYLSEDNGNNVCPAMITVGILNTKRTRDLTPYTDPQMEEENGQGHRFLEFINKELFPFIDSLYHPAPYRMLVGHSYGALFSLMALTDRHDLFNSYIAIDPSMFWDNYRFLDSSIHKFSVQHYDKKSLYIAIANNTGVEKDSEEARKDTSSESAMTRGTIRLVDHLASDSGNGLNWQAKYYRDEDHGTLPVQAMLDGMKFIFKEYKFRKAYLLLGKEVTPDAAIGIVEQHFKKLSSAWGTELHPQESLINRLGYLLLNNSELDKAKRFFQYNIDHFPGSANAYDSMGDYYRKKGDKVMAMEMSRKSLVLEAEDK